MKQNNNRQPKAWICPSCGNTLGQVVFGELYINGNAELNTDGINVVVYCQSCGTRKIWYTEDRLSSIMKLVAGELNRYFLAKTS